MRWARCLGVLCALPPGIWVLSCWGSFLPSASSPQSPSGQRPRRPLPSCSSAQCPAGHSRPFQELQQLLHRTRQEARARLQAREHEAERLRIEIVTLREALEEETAARASLEGQLRVQREETGEGPASSPAARRLTSGGATWAEEGRRGRTSLHKLFFLSPPPTEVLEGEYGRRPGRGWPVGKEPVGA